MKSILKKEDYIQEGANPAPGVIILACTVGDNYDDPDNRVLIKKDNEFFEFGSTGDAVLSVDATQDGKAYVLGENGSVIEFNWSASTETKIKASRKIYINDVAEEIGPLRCIRVMGNSILCAGSAGQVYELYKGKFKSLPVCILEGIEQTIQDIVGISSSDFVAVTSEGHAARFDGSRWHNLDVPTQAGLNRICICDDGSYLISGKESTLIVGRPGEWNKVEPRQKDLNYWGVAAKGNVAYAAYLGGIDIIKDGYLSVLKIAGKDNLEFTELCEGPDGICSFAGHTVGVIDNNGWRTVLSN